MKTLHLVTIIYSMVIGSSKTKAQLSLLISCVVFLISNHAFATTTTTTHTISEEQNSTFKSFQYYGDTLNIEPGGTIEVTGNDDGIDVGEYNVDINIDAADNDGVIVDKGYAITGDLGGLSHVVVNLNVGKIYSNNKAIVLQLMGPQHLDITTINTAAQTSISGTNRAIEIENANLEITNAGVINSDNDAIYITYDNKDYTTTITNSGEINGNITINNGDGDSARLTNNAGIINGNITFGESSASSVTLNDGTINGNITLGHVDQVVNLNGGTYVGIIQGNEEDFGIVNVNGNMVLDASSKIGDSTGERVGVLNINDGADLTVNGEINVKNSNVYAGGRLALGSDNIELGSILNVQGTLDLGDENRTINNTFIRGSGSGVIDFSSGSHHLHNILLDEGNTIKVDILQASHGNIITDNVVVNEGVKLIATTGNDYQYIANGDKRKIIDSLAGAFMTKIEDENINADQGFSILKYSTSVEEEGDRKAMYLHISRANASDITSNTNAQAIYNTVNNVGSQATKELKVFQEYLDNATSTQQVANALKAVLPQHGGGIIRNNINNVSTSAKILENRFNQQRLASLRPMAKPRIQKTQHMQPNTRRTAPKRITKKYRLINHNSQAPTSSSSGNKFRFHSGKSFGDNDNNKEIWGQVFGVNTKQSANTGDGYQSRSKGFAFGYDKKISKDRTIGVNVSYAASTVESSDFLKKTDIDTYQVNLYHGKNFNKYFFDTIVGFAWNQYQSNRAITVLSSNAHANFSGQTYLAKTTLGHAHYVGGGFSIIPHISLNFVHNKIDGYEEKGAGTLGLEVASSHSNFLEGRVGVELDHYFINAMGTTINSQLRTSYGYDFIGERQSIRSNFVGQTATFSTALSRVDRQSFMIGAGLSIVNRDDITLNLDYNFEKKEHYAAHSGLIKAKYGF